MPDMAAFASAFASLKAAGEIAKALVHLRDTATFQTQLIELQGQILSAQASALTAQADQSALLERKRDLEEEVASLKAWDAEKQNYELAEIRQMGGSQKAVFAYRLKSQAEPAQPSHYLCANCYTHGEKSILQPVLLERGRIDILLCQGCGSHLNLTGISYEDPSKPKPSRQSR